MSLYSIHTRFLDEQKRLVTKDSSGKDVYSVVYPPRTASEQIRVEARRQFGNAQIRKLHPTQNSVQSGGASGIKAAFAGGSSISDIVIFFAVKLAARIKARWDGFRGRGTIWARDLSTRAV